jgi:hypothetical protein
MQFLGMQGPECTMANLNDSILTSDGRNLLNLCQNFQELPPRSLMEVMHPGVTFYDHYRKRVEGKSIALLDGFVAKEKKSRVGPEKENQEAGRSLLPAFLLSGKMTLIDLFSNNCVEQSSFTSVHVLPQACFPLGRLCWYNAMLLAPAVLSKFEYLFIAFELEQSLRSQLAPLVIAEHAAKEQLNPGHKFPPEPWPNTSLFLKAMTPSRNQENTSSER